MPHRIDSKRAAGNGFRLEFGSRTDRGARAATSACVWLIRTRNQQEMARADRCSATGELRLHFLGGQFHTAAEFDDYLNALAKMRQAATTLPTNPEPAGL